MSGPRGVSHGSDASGVRVANRRSVRLAALPRLSPGELASALASWFADGWRIISLFGTPEDADRLLLCAVVAHDARGQLMATTAVVPQRYPALALRCHQAARFEREIAEQCGAIPDDVAPVRPLRRHAPDHRPSSWAVEPRDHGAHECMPVAGEEIHEVAVGPVHAGIIEPGHFRFQAHGEEVLHLDITLGYQHRGVERLLEQLDRQRATFVAESIAGDSVIAHTSAWCGAVEALARSHKSPRAQAVRGVALELERLANHIGDLGAMSGDIAYQPAAAYFGRMRGECLNLLMTLSGNRYGRGLIRPGGAAFDIPAPMAVEVATRIASLRDELAPVADLLFGNAAVQSRLEGVGRVTRDECVTGGFVGPTARAAELPRDVRHDHPYGVFRFAQVPVATAWAGDVFARAMVRWLEVQRSLAFVEEQVAHLPAGPVRSACGALAGGEIVVALEEGWRGEVAHVLVTDDDGRIRRHKVVDPSFHNWPAVALAIRGNEISDFPLCNKSFNLSYAGADL